jgi:hypothetical protein
VREPTFVSYWNNTDNFWNESKWLSRNGSYPNEGVRDFWVCAGGAPVKLVYEYYRGTGTVGAMIDPIAGGNVPGQVRLGIVYPPPDFAGQGKSARGVPVTYPGIPGTMQIPLRSPYVGSGRFAQANKENVAAATLAAPYPSSSGGSCASGLPSTPEYWCSDPIQKRRGQLFGTPAQPLYLEPIGGGVTPTDVDAVPLAVFTNTTPLALGTIRFDTDTTLISCPAQPPQTAPTPVSVDPSALHTIELLEEARDLGVSGETEAGSATPID